MKNRKAQTKHRCIYEKGKRLMKYQIKVRGKLDQDWSEWLGAIEIVSERQNGDWITQICADVPDQPALFGILDHIRDLSLPLLSVNPVPKADESEA